MHASASPFEALAERMNWRGVDAAEDTFGKGLFAAGLSPEDVAAWSQDPQLPFEGQKLSLFDMLEDLDADECLAKAKKILDSWDEYLPKFWHVYPQSEAEAPEVSGIPATDEVGEAVVA